MTDLPPQPPLDAFAAFVRRVAEAHDEWDLPAQFVTLHTTDAGEIGPGTVTIIDPGINPGQYPLVFMRASYAAISGKDAGTLCGYLLAFEGWGVPELPAGAGLAAQAQQYADRANRMIHTRPDRQEFATTLGVDLRDNMWGAFKTRIGDLEEPLVFTDPARNRRTSAAGGLTAALRSVAKATHAVLTGQLPPGFERPN